MKRIIGLLGAFVGLLALGAAPARAQEDSDLIKDWQIRLGLFLPVESASRAKGGDVWFAIGAERKIYEATTFYASIAVDYYGMEGVYNVPITANVYRVNGPTRFGVGVGIGTGSRANGDGIIGFVYQFSLAYQLSYGYQPLSLEVRWYGTSGSNSELNGIGVYGSLRF